MPAWTAFPQPDQFRFDAGSLAVHWPLLHAGDAEPLPQDPEVLRAWALFHSGRFHEAAQAGLKAGGAGITAANRATAIYATHLEKKEKTRLDLFMTVAQRAQAQTAQEANNPNAWYWQAYALGRYSQGISVAKALAQGLGSQVKQALEKTIKLQPRHADAHVALAMFHAEVIDKVGSLIGGMTYGTKKEVGLKLFQDALKINPGSAISMIECANGILMLEGEKKMSEATRLYEQAVAIEPMDAMEWLHVQLAKAELAE
jgi:tetratricopeptide (TPR) repeat protein